MGDNKRVYKEQIKPLMRQMADVCREHNIPMSAMCVIDGDVSMLLRGRGRVLANTMLSVLDEVLGVDVCVKGLKWPLNRYEETL